MVKARTAKFQIGQIVRHRIFSFRGVIYDIDPALARVVTPPDVLIVDGAEMSDACPVRFALSGPRTHFTKTVTQEKIANGTTSRPPSTIHAESSMARIAPMSSC